MKLLYVAALALPLLAGPALADGAGSRLDQPQGAATLLVEPWVQPHHGWAYHCWVDSRGNRVCDYS